MRSPSVALFAALLCALVSFGADENQFRLALDLEGKTYSSFSVKDGWIVLANEGETAQRVPEYAQWRLEGDFLRHAIAMNLMPVYRISRQTLPEWQLASMEQPYEVGIQLNQSSRTAAWSDDELKNSIAIFAWIVDRKPVRVFAMDALSMRDAWIRFAVSGQERNGFPAIMLHNGEAFIPPRPLFADAAANNLVVGMHFGSTETLETMLKQVDRVDERGRFDYTLLHVAAATGRADAVSALVERRAKTKNKDRDGRSPLALAAANGRLVAVKSLLALDADPDQVDRMGRPPLFAAIANGHDEVALKLIASDTNWRQRDDNDQDAVTLALEGGRANVVRTLATQGGLKRHEEELSGYLVKSIRMRRLDTVKALLENKVDPNSVDQAGTPAIVLAAETGLASLVEALLSAGANPDYKDASGATALIGAVRAGFQDSAIALLDGGANPNATDSDGNTATHVAISANQNAMIEILANHGADLDFENASGDSAFDLAWKTGNKVAADALVVAGLHFEVESAQIMERIERAISFDLGELVERAIEDEWDATRRFKQKWPIAVVAEFYSALRTMQFLQETLPAEPPPPIVSASELTNTPLPHNVPNPVDPRPADQNHPKVVVTVRGLLDADGKFLFPRVTSSPDERLSRAVLDIIPSWEFIPGSKSGQPASTLLTVPVTFPARNDRIYALGEIDTPPRVYRGKPMVSVPAWELADIEKKRSSDQGPSIIEKMNTVPYTIELPPIPKNEEEPPTHVVSFVVERNGRLSNIEILTPATAPTRSAITDMLEKSEFTPGRLEGNAVRVRLVTKIDR